MKMSEIFYSIQGEGIKTGLPSVFFRVSHCNLRCHWCDTPYTSWKPENKEVTVEQAVNMIEEYGCKNVVITGGEPFVWKKELRFLCDQLWYDGYHITIETNATIFEEVEFDLMSMSPKLESSTPYDRDPKWAKKHDRERVKIDVIDEFISRCTHNNLRDYQLKFVVVDGSELEEIQDILGSLRQYSNRNVLLMPEGRTAKEVEDKQLWLVELCMAHGFRYSDRLHTRLWGTKRGV